MLAYYEYSVLNKDKQWGQAASSMPEASQDGAQ